MISPCITAYRVPFYDRFADGLAQHGVELSVASNAAPPSMARRGDVRGGPWARDVPTSWLTLGGREIPLRRVAAIMRGLQPDLVVVEQALRNPETYSLLARRAAGRYGVAMWGHGRSYASTKSSSKAAVKQWLTQWGDWFFAYTQAGAEHVVRHGFPRARVSVLNNTIDIGQLQAELDGVDPQVLSVFRREHGLTPGRTALFLGGVDEKKGIGFLLESARIAGEAMPGFVLLVAGDGDSLQAAQAAQAAGVPVRVLGRADGHAKALALSAADLLAIPEWIGLVAVDALVSGRPIVTTDHPSHQPEYDYLVPGETSLVAPHHPAEYARSLVSTLNSTECLAKMQVAAREAAALYPLDWMVDSFVEGVLGWRDLRQAGLTTGGRPSPRAADSAPSRAHEKPLLAVLMACHNRRDQSLTCLRALRSQDRPDADLRVYLTDDGSTDGTASAVAGVDLPIHVIPGTGELYWAASMALAERAAMSDDPDLLLWLNDDVTLDPDALARLLAVHEQAPDAIIVGNVRDVETGEKTYGGRNRRGRHPQRFLAAPSAGQVQRVSAFNGNVVLVPRGVRDTIGPIDGSFAHAYADDDYGLRASKVGVAILCAADTVGTCSDNPVSTPPQGMRVAWARLQAPTGLPWRSQVRYLRRHGGALWLAYLSWGYGKAIMLAGMRKHWTDR